MQSQNRQNKASGLTAWPCYEQEAQTVGTSEERILRKMQTLTGEDLMPTGNLVATPLVCDPRSPQQKIVKIP